jgi:4-amino-4-deoxy-L-arabinose transferase-like glycosyltransferase
MQKILSRFGNIKNQTTYILIAIVLLGIFLRAYDFNNLQRFDQDEARDVVVVQQMAKDHNFLIMGPYASGTNFDLGPGYYYMEYVSVLIFGNDPASFGYPILFFSILAIPLLYVVLKKFFSENISLSLTAIYSVSFYGVKYSRFAWNPNPLPFFVLAFLWLLLKLIEDKKTKPKTIWSILLGIVVGLGIQLHTIIIFLFLPVLPVFFAFYLFKKYPLKKSFAIVLFTIAFINIPQFIHEYRTNGENTQAFIQGVILKTNYPATLAQYFTRDLECYTQGNSYMLSSANNESDCDVFHHGPKNPIIRFGGLALALLLFLGGIGLLFYYLKKETDSKKKEFLALSSGYIILAFFVFLAFAYEVDIRYFIVVFFMPFLFLGLWMKFLMERLGKWGIVISYVLVVILCLANIIVVGRTYFSGINPDYAGAGNFGGMDLKDAKLISQFIQDSSSRMQTHNIYVTSSDDQTYVKTMGFYLKLNAGISVTELKYGQDVVGSGAIVFLIINDRNQNKIYNNPSYTKLDFIHIDTYDVYVLQKN